MRELKFRAWNKFHKKWILDVLIESSDNNNFTLATFHNLNETIKDEEETVHIMQYTGLKDKNGKEIYEGDIIEYNNLFDEEIRKQIIKNMTEWLIEYGYEYEEMCSYRNIIVLGNIYENGDLI